MTKKNFRIFTSIAIITTIWWFYQNTTSGFLIDGIIISSAIVTIVSVITSTITWLLVSWADAANKNNVKVITSQNLLLGALSGYVIMSFFSGWMGPMTGIVFGVLSGISGYGIFSIKRKISSRQSIVK